VQATEYNRLADHLVTRVEKGITSTGSIDDAKANFLLAKLNDCDVNTFKKDLTLDQQALLATPDEELKANPALLQKAESEAGWPIALAMFRQANAFCSKLMQNNDQRKAVYTELYEWLKAGQFQLQPMTHSKTHQLLDFLAARVGPNITSKNPPHSFLVKHNWAAAFAGDKEFDDKTNAPAPHCCFEFNITGRIVIVIVSNDESETAQLQGQGEGTFISLSPYADWLRCDQQGPPELKAKIKALCDYAWLNVKAICVALEAEVAETEIVRIPHKLNAARGRRGKNPLPDYHIINLANRKRYAPVPADLHSDAQARNSPRLHFRRGHWRHFQNYKTWIKWQLVGNADLGFIDKDYRL
jgi:hypothetical protein